MPVCRICGLNHPVNKWFEPVKELGASADMTPKQLVDLGIAHGESYLQTGKHYLALWNVLKKNSPTKAAKFKQASELAFHIHRQTGK